MKSLVSRLSNKVIASVAAIAAIAGMATVAGAWSPDRPTYTIENPAPHVTFNSITNNPNEGDERPFFEVKDATHTGTDGFSNRAEVENGQELLLRMYVHNNASSSLNGEDFDGPGVAKNTQVRVHLPTATDNALRANAYISADNAQPKVVADTVDFVGNSKFNLAYVPGSAVAYTNAVPSGIKLSDNIVKDGAPVGYTAANGIVPGCFEYDMIVTLKVKVNMPSYKMQKSVRLEGQSSNDWKESVTTTPGQNVEWRIAFENTGETQLQDVTVLDEVPAGLNVVPGSVKLYNSNNPDGYTYPDSAIQKEGRHVNANIGTYNAGSNAFLLFTTKTPSLEELECGVKKFDNIAYATPKGSGSLSDGASVNVDTKKPCEEEKPVYRCEVLKAEKIGVRKYRFTVEETAQNGATVKQYRFDFGDDSEELVTDQRTVEHTFPEEGTFNVVATVDFTVDGETVSDTREACEAIVNTKKEQPTTPTTLPKTGAGDLVGMVAAVSVAAGLTHKFVWARRYY